MNGGPISWKSRRQDNVSLSTSEAEFVATSLGGKEAIYLRKTLTNFGFPQTKATFLYRDNPACVAMSERPVRRKFSRQMREIECLLYDSHQKGKMMIMIKKTSESQVDSRVAEGKSKEGGGRKMRDLHKDT